MSRKSPHRTVRAIEDNMLMTVNQRTFTSRPRWSRIDDVLIAVRVASFAVRSPAGNAIQPIVPSLGTPAYEFNEYIASWAETARGFNRYSAGTDRTP